MHLKWGPIVKSRGLSNLGGDSIKNMSIVQSNEVYIFNFNMNSASMICAVPNRLKDRKLGKLCCIFYIFSIENVETEAIFVGLAKTAVKEWRLKFNLYMVSAYFPGAFISTVLFSE